MSGSQAGQSPSKPWGRSGHQVLAKMEKYNITVIMMLIEYTISISESLVLCLPDFLMSATGLTFTNPSSYYTHRLSYTYTLLNKLYSYHMFTFIVCIHHSYGQIQTICSYVSSPRDSWSRSSDQKICSLKVTTGLHFLHPNNLLKETVLA